MPSVLCFIKGDDEMTQENYNEQLYEKMKAEQDKYREWLLSQPPAEILNHT